MDSRFIIPGKPRARPKSWLARQAFGLTKAAQGLLLKRADPVIQHVAEALFSGDLYWQTNPDLVHSGLLPALDYFWFGAVEGRNPHPLFDASYYLETNPDVRQSRDNPLLHYVCFGAKEGRNPHLLFDTDYYLARYPDAAEAFNPLLHFLEIGQREDRQSSPYFDAELYRRLQPEACRKCSGALVHYLLRGASEGRPPNSQFDPEHYVRVHQDVAAAKVEPLKHYIQLGRSENRVIRAPRFESARTEAYLPVVKGDCLPASPVRRVSVIIFGTAESIAAQSLSATANRVKETVIFAGDRGPHEVAELTSLFSEDDVVVLDGDVQVFGNWLDRLSAHAYSGDVATVSVFSNRASLSGYPKYCQENRFAEDVALPDLDSSLAVANAGRHCRIKTASRGCTYIRRETLNATGPFVLGEEDEFCLRATKQGWWHLLAADTFVYQQGVCHPANANPFPSIDPANAYRISATLYRMVSSDRPVRLNILHQLGGGTLEHVRRVAQLTQHAVTWLNLEPAPDSSLRLYCERPGFEFSVTFHAATEKQALLDILSYVKLNRIHVHHLLGFPIDMKAWVRECNVPYDVTLHDYYSICARIHLKDDYGRYCGEGSCRCEDVTRTCTGCFDLLSWRSANGAFLSAAERVIAPSFDTAKRIESYFPWIHLTPAWHEQCDSPVRARHLSSHEPLKIAVLGTMALHKGFHNLRECVALTSRHSSRVEFVLIGGFDDETATTPHDINSTGAYTAEQLPELLKNHSPHLVWFPCQWPETFSYTLSACLTHGLPVAVPNLGAFAERLHNREWSWVLPWETTPAEWLRFFEQIRRDHFLCGTGPDLPQAEHPAQTDFYPAKFLSSQKNVAMRSVLTEPKLSVFAIASSFANGQMQACGYIRLVQPLTHPSLADEISLSVVDIETALTTQPDALVVQRTVIPDVQTALGLLRHCRAHSIRLIYEIDDDLFNMPIDHLEHAAYKLKVQAAELLARNADAVTISTEPLRARLLNYNSNVILIPNYIDERLWDPAFLSHVENTSKRIRALYMGSSTHQPDLALLEEPVRVLKQSLDFELEVIGVSEDVTASWFKAKRVPDEISGSYPNFVRWLKTQGPWDFAVAPLHDSPFNSRKSAIKIYDYAALNLPTIASAVVPYCEVIQHGETGLLARNTTLDWQEALRCLTEQAGLRQQLSEEVSSRRGHWTLGANAEQLRQGWRQALFAEVPVSAPVA